MSKRKSLDHKKRKRTTSKGERSSKSKKTSNVDVASQFTKPEISSDMLARQLASLRMISYQKTNVECDPLSSILSVGSKDPGLGSDNVALLAQRNMHYIDRCRIHYRLLCDDKSEEVFKRYNTDMEELLGKMNGTSTSGSTKNSNSSGIFSELEKEFSQFLIWQRLTALTEQLAAYNAYQAAKRPKVSPQRNGSSDHIIETKDSLKNHIHFRIHLLNHSPYVLLLQ